MVSIDQLLDAIGESPATIHRDLSFLSKNGFISRSHGYVRFRQPAFVQNIEITEEKTAVARAAAAMIPPDTMICVDSGVFTLALAHQISGRSDISVMTNSLSVANALAPTNVATYITCGCLDGRQEAILGPEAEEYIRSMRFPLLFLTTTGVRSTQGLVCVTPSQATMKRALLQSAQKTVLLTDSKAFQTDSVRIFATFDEIDVIILDRPLNNTRLEQFLMQKGTAVIVANGCPGCLSTE